MLYFDDLTMDMASESSDSYTFTAEEIKSFAGKWDPMPFHIDEDIAKASPIGALFASSIHIIAAAIKLSHAFNNDELAAIAGLGWNDVRFIKPVFADDSIHVKSEVVELRESKSKPDQGIMTTKTTIYNQHDEQIGEYKIATLVYKKQ